MSEPDPWSYWFDKETGLVLSVPRETLEGLYGVNFYRVFMAKHGQHWDDLGRAIEVIQ